jgi:hypothetical protein
MFTILTVQVVPRPERTSEEVPLAFVAKPKA